MESKGVCFKIVTFIFIFLASALLVTSFAYAKGSEKVRVIAQNTAEVEKAVSDGCKLIKNVKKSSVLECTSEVSKKINLKEDIEVSASDVNVNTQVGANFKRNNFNFSGNGTKVAVLDTGYNYNHPDLKSSYLGGYDMVNEDYDPMDDNGHGSHVSGIITSDGIIAPNARGIAPDTGIIAIKVLNSNGDGYLSDLASAIYWVVDTFSPDAISISVGSKAPYLYSGFCDNVYPDLTNSIKYAVDKNVSVIVSAGNGGSGGVSIPGCISYATTVGAVDSMNKIATFSGNGSAVDIYSPGVDVYSTWLGNEYRTLSGTSMATPVVSGTIALMKSKDKSASYAEVNESLSNGAELVKIAKKTFYKIVDAYHSIKLI